MNALAPAWLAAWCLLAAVPAGATALLLLHALTGGRWGDALAEALRPAARAMPLVALLFLPLLFDLAALYPWAAGEARPDLPPDVAAAWLNPAGFTLRAVAILLLWSLLGWLAASPRLRPALAAPALAVHSVAACIAGFDWLMSRDPDFHATAFGAAFAVSQLLAALAWCAFAAAPKLRPDERSDLGKLLLGVLAGFAYLWFMIFLVAWSGNLPAKAAWFLARIEGPWLGILLALLAGGLLLPLGLLFTDAGRRAAGALRPAGVLVLAGLGLLQLWLVRPEPAIAALPWLVLPLAAFCAVAMIRQRLGRAPARGAV
ncbi:hypothetical protein ACFOGJ_25450 [Marinibaculum pumilum]|uniref:NnrS family protein n=1 Tax=Marinibaculum pumilum TaxID=1766165 RepID=A0ABV7L871_9PROT